MFFRRSTTRIDALEAEAEAARAERDHMRQVLAAFQIACEVAGVGIASAAADGDSLPPALLLACRAPRPGGEPVLLTSGGRQVIAVIGSGGSPDDWMPAISSAAQFTSPRHVTTVTRTLLPEGLLAVAAVPADGSLAISTASTLTARQTRDAVAVAIRAARRTGWHDYKAGAVSAVAILGVLALKAAPVKVAATATAAVAGGVAASLVLIPITNVPYSVHALPPPPHPAVVAHHGRRRTEPGGVTTPQPGTGNQATGQLAAADQPDPAGTTGGVASGIVSQLPVPTITAEVSPGSSTSVDVTVPAPVPSVTTCVYVPLVGQVCLAA